MVIEYVLVGTIIMLLFLVVKVSRLQRTLTGLLEYLAGLR